MFPKSKEAPPPHPHPHPHKKKTTSLNICTTLLLTNRYSTTKWRYPVCISAPFCRVVLKPCVVDALLSKWHKYNRDAEVNACPQSLPEQNSTLHWNLHTHTHARARARTQRQSMETLCTSGQIVTQPSTELSELKLEANLLRIFQQNHPTPTPSSSSPSAFHGSGLFHARGNYTTWEKCSSATE